MFMQKRSRYTRNKYKLDDESVIRCIFCDKVESYIEVLQIPPLGDGFHTVCRGCMPTFELLQKKNIHLWDSTLLF